MTAPVQIGDATRIYALVEPFDHDVARYIGKTTQPLFRRLIAHKRAAMRGELPVHRWIRKRLNTKFGPVIRWIETVPVGGDWVERERYWIASARRNGHNILNLTDGGEGLPGHSFSAAHREKISAALKRGTTHNCDQCGARFYRKPKDARSKNLFCSRTCYQTWQRGRHKDNSSGLMGVAGRAAALKAKRLRRG